jgi:tetratricopeptide (TPR) repeat protein
VSRRSIPLAVFLAVVSLTAIVHARIPSKPKALEGEAFVPRPQVAKLASLGFDSLLSDFHWLRAVQVAGGGDSDPTQHAEHLGRLIDVVTSLDPWVDHPYRFAAIWMTDTEERVREANRLLRRGIEHHPEDWRGYFYLGFNHFFYLGENQQAAQVLEQAIQRPGAPRYLPRLVARLRAEGADLDAAEVFLRELLRNAPDEYAQAEYQGALDEIEVERQARFLDRARRAYRELSGEDISHPMDLLHGPHAVLSSLPSPEPSSLPPSLRRGSEWILDAESDRFVSSYYGHRYQLSFHPLDEERMRRWRQRRESAAQTGD